MKKAFSIWIVLISLSMSTYAQGIAELSKQRVDAEETPGIAVAIFEDGKSNFYSYGFATTASHELVTSKTLFEIGSVTKTFTCSVLSYLVQTHEMSLTDPAQKYLPQSIMLPEKNKKFITLEHLATAHSGLSRMPGNFNPADPGNPYIDYTERELTAYLNNCELLSDPGTTYEYSNLGMGLLGFILTQKKNKSYSDLVREVVLTPLGMNQTFISGEVRNKLLASGYREMVPVSAWTWRSQSVLTGAGGIVSNAEDMLRFLIAQLSTDNAVLNSAFQAAQKERSDAGSSTMQIGLGWHIRDHKYIWHNGGTGGFRSFVGFDPIKKRAIVILTNSTTGIDDLGFHWLDELIPLKIVKKPMKLNAAAIKEYVGVYEVNPTFKISITSKGTDLFLQATAQPVVSIYAEEADKFFLKVVEAKVHFMRGPNNQIEKLVLYQNGSELVGKKIN